MLRKGGMMVVDPDAIAREEQIPPIAAGRVALRRIRNELSAKRSFAFETTLAGSWALGTMRDARVAGYRVTLTYIGTSDVEINLARIRARVLTGGHDVAAADVRRWYGRSMARAAAAAALAHEVAIYDNSSEAMQLVAERDIDGSSLRFAVPRWAVALVESVLR
jgi:predicted ABC-type ATPase